MNRRGAQVIMAIDEALFLGAQAPVLFLRCSKEHMRCNEFVAHYDAYASGYRGRHTVQLDDPALRRRTKVRRKRNAIARASRKRNRSAV